MLICSLILWCLEQIWLVCWRSLTNIRKSIKFKIIKHNNSPKSSDTHTLLVHFNTFRNRTMNVANGMDQLWVYDKALKYVGSKNILSLQSPIHLRGSLKKFALRRMKSSVHKIVYRQMNGEQTDKGMDTLKSRSQIPSLCWSWSLNLWAGQVKYLDLNFKMYFSYFYHLFFLCRIINNLRFFHALVQSIKIQNLTLLFPQQFSRLYLETCNTNDA